MSRKVIIGVIVACSVVILIAIVVSLFRNYQQSKGNNIPTIQNTVTTGGITYTSHIPGWMLSPQVPVATTSSTISPKTLNEIVSSWGLWEENGVQIGNPNTLSNQDSQIKITVKNLEINLIPEPQPYYPGIDDASAVVFSIGETFDTNSQTLTMLVNVSPNFLQMNSSDAPLENPAEISPALTQILLARIYQLANPDVTPDYAKNIASNAYTKLLSDKPIFVLQKQP